MTLGISFLFEEPAEIPDEIARFTRIRPDAFEHNKTHVEAKTITPASINVPANIFDRVFDTAVISDGVRIATASTLVALKLGRLPLTVRDSADIVDFDQDRKGRPDGVLIESGSAPGVHQIGGCGKD